MPNQNVTKINVPDNYYHVYAHGVDGQQIYSEGLDYQFFLSLLERYLLKNDSVEALVYYLASNHFDLLLYQIKDSGVAKLMHDIVIDYNQYFYEKYGIEDLLSESGYKVLKILPDNLLDVSRYIHLSPSEWIDYPYSSIRAYLYDDVPDWLDKKRIAGLYGSTAKYLEFLEAF